MYKLEQRKVDDLTPHPHNIKYFGYPDQDPSFPTISESIHKNGIREPPIIKEDGTILSGHIRVAGFMLSLAKKGVKKSDIKKELIQVQVHPGFENEEEEVRYLIEANLERRQLTLKKITDIWDLFTKEYVKPGMGRPAKNEVRTTSPKELASELGVTVKAADSLVVIKNSPLVPDSVKEKVFNKKLSSQFVAKAITFAEEEAKREQREPTQDDVIRYLQNPPPKKASDVIQEVAKKPVTPKPAEKPAAAKAPEPPIVEAPPEPSFEDVLVQPDEPSTPTEVVEVKAVELEVAVEVKATEPEVEPVVETKVDKTPVEEPPTVEEPPAVQAGVFDLHTEFPISTIKVDPQNKELWKKHLQIVPPVTPEEPQTFADTTGTYADAAGTFADPSNTFKAETEEPLAEVVKITDARDRILAKYIMTDAGRDRLASAIKIGFDEALDTLVEKSIEYRLDHARKTIESLLGDIILNDTITEHLLSLHTRLDAFLKALDLIPSTEPATETELLEKNPYHVPEGVDSKIALCQALLSDITAVDNPVQVRDLLLDTIQEAKYAVERLTQTKRTIEPNGLYCVDCLEPQFSTVHGAVCENGHGGAPGITETEAKIEEGKRSAALEPDLGSIEVINPDEIDMGPESETVPATSSPTELDNDEIDRLLNEVSPSSPPAAKVQPVAKAEPAPKPKKETKAKPAPVVKLEPAPPLVETKVEPEPPKAAPVAASTGTGDPVEELLYEFMDVLSGV